MKLGSGERKPKWFVLCCCLLISFSPAYAETFKVGSTGAALGVLDQLAAAFQAEQTEHSMAVIHPSVGSTGAILGVIQGDFALGIISRPLKEKEKASGLQIYEIGRTPFVLATAEKNVAGFNLDELADIYGGRILNWPNGKRLRLVLRPSNDSDTEQLQFLSPAMNEAIAQAALRPGMAVGITDQETAEMIARIPGAIGPSSLALIKSENRSLNPLALNGVMPSLNNLENGSYPYVKTFYLIYPPKPSSGAIAFMKFLERPQTQKLLYDLDFLVTSQKQP